MQILLLIYVRCRLPGIFFPKYLKENLKYYIKTGEPMLLKAYSTTIISNDHIQKAV